MICDNCNKTINDHAVYCEHCGKKHNKSSLDKFEDNLSSSISLADENGGVLKELSLSLGDIIERPDWRYYLKTASEISSKGELFEALEWCNKAMELNSSEPLIFNIRGLVYYELDKNKEAINDYNFALKLNPEYFPALLNRALIKSELGLHKEAIADYDLVLKLKPGNLKALNNRAGSKVEEEDFVGAQNDITIVLQDNPDDAIAQYILAKALLGLGDRPNAMKYFYISAKGGFELSNDELRKLL